MSIGVIKIKGDDLWTKSYKQTYYIVKYIKLFMIIDIFATRMVYNRFKKDKALKDIEYIVSRSKMITHH